MLKITIILFTNVNGIGFLCFMGVNSVTIQLDMMSLLTEHLSTLVALLAHLTRASNRINSCLVRLANWTISTFLSMSVLRGSLKQNKNYTVWKKTKIIHYEMKQKLYSLKEKSQYSLNGRTQENFLNWALHKWFTVMTTSHINQPDCGILTDNTVNSW